MSSRNCIELKNEIQNVERLLREEQEFQARHDKTHPEYLLSKHHEESLHRVLDLLNQKLKSAAEGVDGSNECDV